MIDTAVNPTTEAPKATVNEAISASIQALIEQLKQGHSAALIAYLTSMGRFHNYSFGNILEIARQKPDATHVAGFYGWKQLGRSVKKGEHGIRILAPIISGRSKSKEEADDEGEPRKKTMVVGFRRVCVFESQTDGKDLPELAERTTGSVGGYRDRLFGFASGQGIEVEFSEAIAPALGVSYGGRIALKPGHPAPEEFTTLVHELARDASQDRAPHSDHQNGA